MAKVTAGLMSLSAKKSLNKTITYQNRKSGGVAYLYTKPGDRGAFTPSVGQLAQRAKIGSLVAEWQALSAGIKNLWNELAKILNFVGTGYHYFLHLGGIFPVVHSWSDSGVAWSDADVGWSGYPL